MSKISCGVSQESIIFSLLFPIYVNDIKQVASSDLLLYADSILKYWGIETCPPPPWDLFWSEGIKAFLA